MNKQVTIVIPCKNEKQGVINVLKLVKRQHLDCIVIVADSSDDPESKKLLEHYSTHPVFCIKIIKGGIPAVARNNGAKLVTTPYVLFLDADIYIKEPDLLSFCVEEMIKADLDLLTCKLKTITGAYNWVFRMFDLVQRYTSKKQPFAVGGFMLFKTKTFRDLGGFDDTDIVAEDYRLSKKVNPNKFKIVNKYVYTLDRRFKNKGVFYMIKLAIKCWINRKNPQFFKQDHGYWK